MRRDRRAGRRCGTFVALLLLAGCSTEPVLSGTAHPPMWEAQSGETRIIMLGSVHQLPRELAWQDDRVNAAIAGADALLLELSPAELPHVPTLFDGLSQDEPVPPLPRRIGTARAERLYDLVAGSGMGEADADRMESWALAMAASAQIANDAGLSRDNGVETIVTRAFAARGRSVTGLETAANQLNAFDNLPTGAQDQMLIRAIDGADDARSRMRRLLSAWARGDVATLAQIADSDVARVPGLRQALVDRRNRAWATQLQARTGHAGTVLVAVGTGHLVGEGALPDLLVEAGWRVRRIQ